MIKPIEADDTEIAPSHIPNSFDNWNSSPPKNELLFKITFPQNEVNKLNGCLSQNKLMNTKSQSNKLKLFLCFIFL